MYTALTSVALKTGEQVEAGVVVGPDLDWAPRVEPFLAHKGGVWNWQVQTMLRQPTGAEAWFFVLHRQMRPFCHVMVVRHGAVGMLGHVFTAEEDRRKGAANALFGQLMPFVREKKLQALVLGTLYDTPPFHIYRSFGFEGVEPQSGYMTWYDPNREAMEAEYFRAGPARVEHLSWAHWPAAALLCVGEGFASDTSGGRLRRCVVRLASAGLIGRGSSESPLLPLVQSHLVTAPGQTASSGGAALVLERTSAVAGLATWARDPLWPQTCIVDVYCHPGFWARGNELISMLKWPAVDRCLAYVDTQSPDRRKALEGAGFRLVANLPQHVAADAARSKFVDVAVMERR